MNASNVSNETQVAEEAVVRVLRATRVNDAAPDAGPVRHSEQTDQCPNVARFAMVLKFGGKWSPEERQHTRGCAFCQKVFGMFASAAAAASDAIGQAGTVSNVDTSQDTLPNANAPKAPAAPAPDDATKPG